MVYMDDIVVYTPTAQQHLEVIRQVLMRLRDAGLKINPKKTKIAAREVEYLGHLVSGDGVRPSPKKIQAIIELAPPKTVREVRMLLGLAGYYRWFIPAYADIARHLYILTRNNAVFRWTGLKQACFDAIKERLCSAPILIYPRRGRKNIINCNASEEVAGAVLMQV